MIPPSEVRKPGIVWKLQKSAYGLYDASRKWFLAVKLELRELKMKPVSGDEDMFSLTRNDELIGVCILHVDNFLVGSTEEFHRILSANLKGRFTFGKIDTEKCKFTELHIQQNKEHISVDQIEFIQALKPITINRVGHKDEKFNKEENKPIAV